MPSQQAIANAITAHRVWRSLLKACLEQGQGVDADLVRVVADPHACDFGKWLDRDDTAPLRHTPDYALIDRMHRDFHKVAAEVCAKIIGGRTAEAEEMMSADGPFTSSSSRLIDALTEWGGRF